jgi:ABC-type phosphate transport system substrate-binding protein
MKQKSMCLAVASVVAALGSSAAMAEPTGWYNNPANYTPATTTDVFLAGSSAVDLGLTKFIAAHLCKANSLDAYRTDSGSTTEYLFLCTSSVTGTLTNLAIHKYTTSSSDGVGGVLNGASAFKYLQVSDVTAATACPIANTVVPAVGAIAPETGIPAYNSWSCGVTMGTSGIGTLSQTNSFGFADMDPTQFTSAANATQLTTVYPYTLIFGIPVTVTLRNALQTKQGLTSGSETEANMPSLTSQQLAGILTGNLTDWAASFGLPSSAFTGGDTNIYTARRSNGSGTTRVIDTNLVGDFCVSGAPAIFTNLAAPQGTTTGAGCASGVYTAQLGTSDDMALCVTNWDTAGVGGVGYLSTDYVPAAAPAHGYRFIKIDGVTPKLASAEEGQYKIWGEASLMYNTAANPVSNAAQNAVYSALKTEFSTPQFVAEVDSELVQPYGTAGAFLSNQLNGAPGNIGVAAGPTTPITDASAALGPINQFTRYNGLAGKYNACQPAQPAGKSNVDATVNP